MTHAEPVLFDHWHPSNPGLAALFEDVQRDAVSQRPVEEARLGGVEMCSFRQGAVVIACRETDVHIDTDFPPFTALWVMQSDGHIIGVSDSTCCYVRPRRHLKTPLVTGEIILFNAHRAHWLDPGTGVFVAVGLDFGAAPTRAEIECRFAETCEAAL